MTRILVVDDEPQLLKTLRITLQARRDPGPRYEVATAADGREALLEAARNPPDAVLLDLGLPDMSGIAVLRSLRAWSPVPVLVLSGRADTAEKVAALDAGADDYVTKPFVMNELLARLRAALRRPETDGALARTVRIGDFALDLAGATVHRVAGDGPEVRLTPTEWRILEVLVRQPGRLVSGRHILLRVWGPGHEDRTNYLRVYVAGLRRKLERTPAQPRHLLTAPGLGYRFEP